MCHTLILAQRFLVVAIRPLMVVALLLFAIPAAYVLVVVIHRLIRAYRSPMRSVPGPKNAHWSKGSFVDVSEEDSLRLQEEWVKTYGHVLRYHSVFGVRFFFTCSFSGTIQSMSYFVYFRSPNSWLSIP
jgi:hypothetical protein